MSDSLQSPAQQGVQLVDIRLQRGQTQVFDGLNLALTEQRIGVIGNNGAGKSSLFRLLCGLELPQAGQVLVDGMPLLQARQRKPGLIGLMFQNPDDQIIFPTVEEELALGLRPQGLSKQQARARARELLVARGLAHWAERAVSSLSQGQRQQVCWLAADCGTATAAAGRTLRQPGPARSSPLGPGYCQRTATGAGLHPCARPCA